MKRPATAERLSVRRSAAIGTLSWVETTGDGEVGVSQRLARAFVCPLVSNWTRALSGFEKLEYEGSEAVRAVGDEMPVENGDVEALKVGFPSFVSAPPPLRLPVFTVIWQGKKGGEGKSFFVDRESPKFTFSAENAEPAVRNSANGRFTLVPRICSSFSTDV